MFRHGEGMDKSVLDDTARTRGPFRWVCRILPIHSYELASLSGMPRDAGRHEVWRCRLCSARRDVVYEPGLTAAEMRERAEGHDRATSAIMWMLDNVEPDYAAGRGTKDGRIVDRDEPWAVPLEGRSGEAS